MSIPAHEVIIANKAFYMTGRVKSDADGSITFPLRASESRSVTFRFALPRSTTTNKGSRITSLDLIYRVQDNTIGSIVPTLTRLTQTNGAVQTETAVAVTPAAFTLTASATLFNRIATAVDTPAWDNQSATTSTSYNMTVTFTGGTSDAYVEVHGIDVLYDLSEADTGTLAVDSITASTTNSALSLNGNGSGAVDINGGTDGVLIDTAGHLSIDVTTTAVASNISHTGAAGVDLTVESTAGSLNLNGGEAAADAVHVQANNAAGGVTITAGTGGLTLAPVADVSQATDITTGVTTNGRSGVITTQSATAAADSSHTFTVTNSHVTATSVILVSINNYSGTIDTNGIPQVIVSNKGAGTYDIIVSNSHGANALSGTLEISYLVLVS